MGWTRDVPRGVGGRLLERWRRCIAFLWICRRERGGIEVYGEPYFVNNNSDQSNNGEEMRWCCQVARNLDQCKSSAVLSVGVLIFTLCRRKKIQS